MSTWTMQRGDLMDPLTDVQVRVLGALIEKALATPDYYPLSLNALTVACNQSSNRDPVVHYEESEVLAAIDGLRRRSLVRAIQRVDSRVMKYQHLLAEAWNLEAGELALLGVLALRGAQTGAELRTRTARLHAFADGEAVDQALHNLAEREGSPLVRRLDRRAGQKEARYTHLLAGEPLLPHAVQPPAVAIPAMHVTDAISQRRSIRKFAERPLTRSELEPLLEAAVLAPNHKLTQPWRYYVLGPVARRRYGLALGDRKARKLPDADAAAAVREKTAAEYEAFPALIAVAMVQSDSPEQREEDYAAVMQAVALMMLVAVERGLGTHVRSGAVMEDPAARAAVGVRDGERIVAILSVGVPAETPGPRTRPAASEFTTWVGL
ncbi:MAG: DUF480 domain-containing protein [Gemmatimonadaceae bacterium]|nr:DUF480 domain-containing protein [Gemmatimonadaceae bacterium]